MIFGLAGNDQINRAPRQRHVIGGGGDDQLARGAGKDVLAGDDGLDGGPGHDKLSGGSGADTLVDRNGTDQLSGDDGDDSLNAADGVGGDVLVGGSHASGDTCTADPRDALVGCNP